MAIDVIPESHTREPGADDPIKSRTHHDEFRYVAIPFYQEDSPRPSDLAV